MYVSTLLSLTVICLLNQQLITRVSASALKTSFVTEHCVAPNGELFEQGTNWHDQENCYKYTCKNALNNIMTVRGCTIRKTTDPYCSMTIRKAKFPSCCPIIICD